MSDLLMLAFTRFDQANSEDPNKITVHGKEKPKELVFAERLTEELKQLAPDACEALLLASRCQHIRRWEIPRSTQPMGRAGYLKWRAGLKKFHAETSAKILREVGYSDEIINTVEALNQKKNLKSDSDCQTLEDALCLVFLKYQFDALIRDTEHEKMIRIVQKTWAKMSDHGHEHALKIDFSSAGKAIIDEALA